MHCVHTLTNVLLAYQLAGGEGTSAQYSTTAKEGGIYPKIRKFFFKEHSENA